MTSAIDASNGQDVLPGLLAPARAVLFDFDGPVCDLFGGRSTAHVAEEIKAAARRHWGELDPDVEACDDSHGILRCLADMYGRFPRAGRSRRPLDLAEQIVARAESRAVETAAPAPHVGTLLGLLRQLGIAAVIVSNNAPGPIRKYLEGAGLHNGFKGVFGRDPRDARRMKPDPDCVNRALAYLGLDASACLLVGDQPTDLKTARSAGTCFLGYTQDSLCAQDMKLGGADGVVFSHAPFVEAARALLTLR
jgi:phosphoglycolate phosphatase